MGTKSQDLEDRYTLPTYSNIRFPLSFVRGEACQVETDDGERYLDLYGGHAVSLLGHSHPRWVEAIRDQVGRFDFYSNMCYHPLRGEAAQLIVEHSYESMHQVFFCNSGAEANETALKIARRATGRPLVVSMEKDFHGRTIGALSVTGFEKSRALFPQNIDEWSRFVPLGDIDAIAALDPKQIAAVILEPIQSVSGVHLAEPEYYRALREHCDRHGIVLIFDEVQTGSGRTGEWYVGRHWRVEPDLVTTAKGLGGGFPVAAVIANERLAGSVNPGDQATTFGGGPMAMAAVVATYRTLIEERLVERVAQTAPRLIVRLQSLRGRGVREVRGLGYLLGIACDSEASEVQRRLLARRILVGGSGDPHSIRLLPPLIVSDAEWDRFFDALEDVLSSP